MPASGSDTRARRRLRRRRVGGPWLYCLGFAKRHGWTYPWPFRSVAGLRRGLNAPYTLVLIEAAVVGFGAKANIRSESDGRPWMGKAGAAPGRAGMRCGEAL